MGWDIVEARITGHVSHHNSDQDRQDDHDWEEVQTRIHLIIKEHKYEKLGLEIY